MPSSTPLLLRSYTRTPHTTTDTSRSTPGDRSVFASAEAVMFIIDAQDELQPAITRLIATISKAYGVNRRIYFEVFIHKVGDNLKMDNF